MEIKINKEKKRKRRTGRATAKTTQIACVEEEYYSRAGTYRTWPSNHNKSCNLPECQAYGVVKPDQHKTTSATIDAKRRSFPLIGKEKFSSRFQPDHAKMVWLEGRIIRAASAFTNKNMVKSGAEDRRKLTEEEEKLEDSESFEDHDALEHEESEKSVKNDEFNKRGGKFHLFQHTHQVADRTLQSYQYSKNSNILSNSWTAWRNKQ